MAQLNTNNKNELFWQTKAGKRIISYGRILGIAGACSILGAVLWVAYMGGLSSIASSDTDQIILNTYTPFVTVAILALVMAGIFFCVSSYQICYKKSLSPDTLRTVNIFNILIAIVFLIFIRGIITILWGIIFIDACRCFSWSKKYMDAQGMTVKQLKNEVAEYEATKTTSTLKGILIILICVFVAIIGILLLAGAAGWLK